MTTLAQIEEAHRLAALHRFHMMKLMKVDEAKATPEDLVLVGKIRAIITPEAMDKARARKDVDDLFTRRVIFFGEKA